MLAVNSTILSTGSDTSALQLSKSYNNHNDMCNNNKTFNEKSEIKCVPAKARCVCSKSDSDSLER